MAIAAAFVQPRSGAIFRFLHDGQVRAEVGVENRVKAQPAQRRDRPARFRRARLETETFADGSADRRRDLREDVLAGVGQCCPDFIGRVFPRKAAVGQTLTHWPQSMQTESFMSGDVGRADHGLTPR